MKLSSYNVTITISDPCDPETEGTVKLENVPREKIQSVTILRAVMDALEEAVL